MKIAIIDPVGGHGGMDYYDFGLCAGLTSSHVDVALYTCDETGMPSEKNFTIRRPYQRIFGVSPALIRGVRYLIGSIKALVSATMESRIICHFHLFGVGPLQLLTITMARVLGRRVIITAHDVESFVSELEIPLMSRWVYRLAHGVIAHNKVSCSELVNRFGVNETKIHIVPHGNYLHALLPLTDQEEARKRLGISPRAPVILFFGQIKEVKGLDILLQAMPAVLLKHPNAILLVAGRPWKIDYAEYQDLIEKLGINDVCISHVHYIPDEDVPLYYSAATVVVLPYRRIYQSGVLLMAMSYGLPVIASDLEGMSEIIKHGYNGLLFKQGNSDDLAPVLEKVLSDSIFATVIGQNGREYVELCHDWSKIGIQTKTIYNQVVENRDTKVR